MLARAENKISRLILFGIPPGTRTLTSGFGDRRAAVTPGACGCTGRGVVGTAGVEPAHSEKTVLQTAAPHHLRRVPIAGTVNIASGDFENWSG